jgi:nicotinate dehydrogenase subunit B
VLLTSPASLPRHRRSFAGTDGAVANAIFDATGVRFRWLPFTPDRIKAGLRLTWTEVRKS